MTTIHINTAPPGVVSLDTSHRPATPRTGDLRLVVVAAGQTRWNLGGGEVRRQLWVNGNRATLGTDYTITLPFLDLLSPVSLDASDEVILSY